MDIVYSGRNRVIVEQYVKLYYHMHSYLQCSILFSIGNIHNQVMVGEARIGAFYVAYALPLALGLCQSQTLRTKSENVMQAEAISHEMVKPIRTWA